MRVIQTELRVVFGNHTLAQRATVSKHSFKGKAASMTAMHLSLQCHTCVLCQSGASVVSPETATAAQTVLQCHDSPNSTKHARRRCEAVPSLEPYTNQISVQHNKPAKVHWLEVGQRVGLHVYPAKHTAENHEVLHADIRMTRHPKADHIIGRYQHVTYYSAQCNICRSELVSLGAMSRSTTCCRSLMILNIRCSLALNSHTDIFANHSNSLSAPAVAHESTVVHTHCIMLSLHGPRMLALY